MESTNEKSINGHDLLKLKKLTSTDIENVLARTIISVLNENDFTMSDFESVVSKVKTFLRNNATIS